MAGAAKIVVGYILVLLGGGVLALSLMSPTALAENGCPNFVVAMAPWQCMAGAALAVLVGLMLLVAAFRLVLERHIEARVSMRLGKRAIAIVAIALTGALAQGLLVATHISSPGTLLVSVNLVLVALIAVERLRVLACRTCDWRLIRNRIPTSDVKAVDEAMKRDDPTAIGGLVAIATSAGPVGVAEMDLEWCTGCRRVARVTFGDKTTWFVDGDAEVVVRAIRHQHP